jgi:predicted dinucleotide-utilizing enzyme
MSNAVISLHKAKLSKNLINPLQTEQERLLLMKTAIGGTSSIQANSNNEHITLTTSVPSAAETK